MSAVQKSYRLHRNLLNPPSRRRYSALNWAVTAICVALVAYWIPAMEAWRALTQVDPWLVMIAALMTVCNIALRGLRWMAVIGLSRIKPGDVLVSTQLCAIALGLNAILPAKAGELARIGLARHHLRLNIGHATQAALTEKLIDAVVLLGTGGLMIQFVVLNGEADYLTRAFQHLSAVALFLVLVVGLSAIPRINRIARRILYTSLHYLGNGGHGRRAIRFLQGFGTGVRRMTLLEFTLISVITPTIWLALGVGCYFLAMATPDMALSLPAAITFVTATVLVTALPSAPGGWGLFEAAGLGVTMTLADPVQVGAAATFVLIAHLVQYIPVVLTAAVAWFWLTSPQK